MVVSLGIEYDGRVYRTCLLEQGVPREMFSFPDAQAMLQYMRQAGGIYPELAVTLSARCDLPCGKRETHDDKRMQSLFHAERYERDTQLEALNAVCATIQAEHKKGYVLPLVRHLPTIPLYRTLYRQMMGFSSTVSAVVTLLYRMRVQEASWTEMRFMYLDLDMAARKIVVLQDGSIIDGITRDLSPLLFQETADKEEQKLVQQAFWEELEQDFASLLALHHNEDIVLKISNLQGKEQQLKDAVIERLGENYQYYIAPGEENEGFESAFGAALVGEGFASSGIAAEVVLQLHLPQPHY